MVRQNGAGETTLGGSHYSWRNECGLHGLLCYDDDDSITDAARNVFLALIVAFATSVVSRRARRKQLYWCGSLCVALCAVQAYYLYQAANATPASWHDDQTHRKDCLKSTKGGKISNARNRPGVTLNPCWCHEGARCVVNGAVVPSVDCPTDGSGRCTDDAGTVDLNIPSKLQNFKRDCSNGRGARCTRKDPCTPCELDRLSGFKDATYCAMCSVVNQGDCKFKPGKGPYCLKRPDSRAIEPCRRCCTESLYTLVETSNGGVTCEIRHTNVTNDD